MNAGCRAKRIAIAPAAPVSIPAFAITALAPVLRLTAAPLATTLAYQTTTTVALDNVVVVHAP